MSARARAALFLLVGVAVLGALVARVGVGEVIRALERASPLYLALAFVTYCVFFVLRGWRWRMLLSESAPSARVVSTTSITAVGWLANSILPLKGGDVLRAALLARKERVTLATSAATVGLERVLDVLGLALVAAAGLFLMPHAAELPAGLERALAIVWLLPLVTLVFLGVLVHWREKTVRVASVVFRPLGRAGRRLVAFGDTVLAGVGALARQPRLFGKVLPMTLLIAISQALIFTWLVKAFLGPSFLLAFSGSAIFLLSFVVSITPGNIGTYEAAFAAVFIGLGLPADLAIPAGLLTHVVTTLTVALLGGAGLFVHGATLGGADRAPTPSPLRKTRSPGGTPP